MPILCLGEAIVDLVCERAVEDLAQADAFRPHFGGAVANVALTAAAQGAAVTLAGGAGDDPWGHWLRERLAAAGVGLDHFRLIPGCGTPLALVTVRPDGEPRFQIYGDGIAATVRAVGEELPAAVAAAEALFFSSNTLAGRTERDLTLAARDRALELGRPVLFDPNLRLHRWPSLGEAVAEANRCVPGALLVRCNRTEAELMTGETDPERAAETLLDVGARIVVVTLGADGALLRGEASARTPGCPARVVSTVGAGDVFTGVLLAHLVQSGFDPAAAAAGLSHAVRESARATERWGAVE